MQRTVFIDIQNSGNVPAVNVQVLLFTNVLPPDLFRTMADFLQVGGTASVMIPQGTDRIVPVETIEKCDVFKRFLEEKDLATKLVVEATYDSAVINTGVSDRKHLTRDCRDGDRSLDAHELRSVCGRFQYAD